MELRLIKKGLPRRLRLILTLNVDASYMYYGERCRSLGMRIPANDGKIAKKLREFNAN